VKTTGTQKAVETSDVCRHSG